MELLLLSEKEIEKPKELKIEDIRFNGTGGTDICGEWNWSGDYEMILSSGWTASKYNFYARVTRKRSRKGNTTGWYVNLYLNMYYSNGQDIKLYKGTCTTLKSAKELIFNRIKEIHEDSVGTEALIANWRTNHARPVFVLDKETGNPILLGTSYLSIGNEMGEKKESLWFHDDIPNYKSHRIFYQLKISYHSGFYLSKTEKSSYGYSSMSEKDERLLECMVKLVEDNPKYAVLFKRLEEFKERMVVSI